LTTLLRCLQALSISLLYSVSAIAQTAGTKNNDYRDQLIGKWYHKSEITQQSVTIMAQSVQDFLPNGTISEQAQIISTTKDGQVSCLVNSSWEWSVSGNKIYQKKIGLHVIPDYFKDHRGQFVNNPSALNEVCEIIKKNRSESLMTTSVFTILKIDSKILNYQYQDSKGSIQESTDHRVNKGLSSYKVN